MAFMVLIITCAYSFFFDKLVNGKPDAYSLISCAAFAIMSLSLSRQSHYGFEVDLLYFFSGGLIVQLMKIKLWLVIVGAGFSYFLIIIRSSFEAQNESALLQVQDQVVIEVNSDTVATNAIQVDSTQASVDTNNAHDLMMPQEANTGCAFGIHKQIASQIDSLHNFIRPQFTTSLKSLEKDNKNVIGVVSKYVDKYLEAVVNYKTWKLAVTRLPIDANLVVDAFPLEIIDNLHKMAKLMVAAGLEKDCCHVYINWRMKFLQECLWRYGLQKLNLKDIDLMEKIEIWTKAFNIAVRILFPNEGRFYQRVFFQLPSAKDTCYKEVCKKLTIHLLNFANTLVTGKHLPNLMCHIIPKVDETLCDMLHEFESRHSHDFYLYRTPIKNELLKVWKRLAKVAKGIFIELEKIIYLDMEQAHVPRDELYPITCEVMKCLRDFSKASNNIMKEEFEEYTNVFDKEGRRSSFPLLVARIIELLERNLEAKSENHTNPALGYFSMVNNLRYIELTIENSQLLDLLGKDWILKLAAKVNQNLAQYETSWNKILDFLKLESNDPMEPSITAESMKDKLNSFNLYFEEICNVQSAWSIFDKQIREQIIISLQNIILPAYGNFIGKSHDFFGNRAYQYIEYGISDIQDRLNHLFLVS